MSAAEKVSRPVSGKNKPSLLDVGTEDAAIGIQASLMSPSKIDYASEAGLTNSVHSKRGMGALNQPSSKVLHTDVTASKILEQDYTVLV